MRMRSRDLPAYLQQLSLESNGKRVTRDGTPVHGPDRAGTVGRNRHRRASTRSSSGCTRERMRCRWSSSCRCARSSRSRDQQTLLVGNALAQAQALLVGRSRRSGAARAGGRGLRRRPRSTLLVAARECPGNRASTTLLLPTLDACNLGALLALYEHRTFVESVLMGMNAFDQWGVELGKTLAKPIIAALEDPAATDDAFDASTRSLIGHARDLAQGR